MDFLDQLLEHDAWTTGQLLGICETLPDHQLDQEFDIGHRTIRRTLDHIIFNMEVWSKLMTEEALERSEDQSLKGMTRRLQIARDRLFRIAKDVAARNSWNDVWYDTLDNPPKPKRFGTTLAHVITHSMHHRAQVLYMLRMCGVSDLPEGDVFSWEAENRPLT